MYRSIKEDSNKIYFVFFRTLLYFLHILEVHTNFSRFKRKRKIKTVHSVGLRTGLTARSMAQGRGGPWPRGSGPSGRASRRAHRRCHRWTRVAAAVFQAPGGLEDSVRQRFEDGDSPGRCGDGGAVEAGWNDGTHRRRRRYGGRLRRRKGPWGS
jgi:hypothetical protein